MSDSGTPLTLQDLQNYQDQQKRQAMAAALMTGNQNNTGAYGGLANAASALLGASTMKNIQNENSPENQVIQQRYGISPSQANAIINPSPISKAKSYLGGLFGLGGSS